MNCVLPCNSSPPAGGINKINISTMSATAYSDWPTPKTNYSKTSLIYKHAYNLKYKFCMKYKRAFYADTEIHFRRDTVNTHSEICSN